MIGLVLAGIATVGLTLGSIEYGNYRAAGVQKIAEDKAYASQKMQSTAMRRQGEIAEAKAAAKQESQNKTYDKNAFNQKTAWGGAAKGYKK